MSTLYQAIIVALIATFIILFLNKTDIRTKVRDWNDKRGISIIADMLDCDFCFSFWTCVFVFLCFLMFGYNYDFLVIFCAPPITRYLL